MIYGYARVSTKGQLRNGNSLNEQERLLKETGVDKIYLESYTGKTKDRPELTKLLSKLKQGDMLVVTKLDRLARSVKDGIEIIDRVVGKGCSVRILNMGMFDDTPTGRLTRNVMLAFAEFERDMILERTREGKEIAREKPGYKEGRPKIEVDYDYWKKQVDKGMTITDACDKIGISRKTWYNHFNKKEGK